MWVREHSGLDREEALPFARILVRLMLLGTVLVLAASGARAQAAAERSPVPRWAEARLNVLAQSHQLRRVEQLAPSLLHGDFDGDGLRDVAILVQQRGSDKTGIVFLHQGQGGTFLVGAGNALGNGGDDFRWMDSWKVAAPSKGLRADRLIVERESSASGMIYFARGRYQWKQLGD